MIANIQGKKIHYLDQGSGNPVILLHGYLEDASMWDYLTIPISEKYRVICVDLPGHGKSDNLDKDISIAHMAILVKGLLDILSIKKALFIGHSMGGYVGLSLMNNFPKAVEKLILFHSKASADNAETMLKRDKAIKMLKQHPSLYIKETISNLFWKENKSNYQEEISQLIEKANNGNINGYIEANIAMKNRPDLQFVLKENDNIVYISGIHDPVIPINLSRSEMNFINADSRFLLNKSGHMGFIEEKEECERILINALKI